MIRRTSIPALLLPLIACASLAAQEPGVDQAPDLSHPDHGLVLHQAEGEHASPPRIFFHFPCEQGAGAGEAQHRS